MRRNGGEIRPEGRKPPGFPRPRRWASALLLLLSLLVSAPLHAALILDLSSGPSEIDLLPYLDVLSDESRAHPDEEIVSGRLDADFRPIAPPQGECFHPKRVWVRLTLPDASPPNRTWLLRQDYQAALSTKFLTVQEDPAAGGRRVTASREANLSESDGLLRSLVYALPQDWSPSTRIYIRYDFYIGIHLYLTLVTPEANQRSTERRLAWYGVYYGILLIMILVNFFIFLRIKHRSYLYYVLFELFVLLYFACMDGLFHPFAERAPPSIWSTLSVVALGFVAALSGQFVRAFLDTPRLSPPLDRVLRIYMSLGILLLALLPLVSLITLFSLSRLLGLLAPTIFIPAGLIAMRRGHRSAPFFLTAWSLFGIGAFLFALPFMEGRTAFTIFRVASMLEAGILAMALVDRMGRLTQERERLTHAVAAAEEVLIESEHRFRALFDQSFQLIAILTPEGRVSEINRTASEALNLKPEEMRGLLLWEAPVWKNLNVSVETFEGWIAQVREGRTLRFELHAPSPEGEEWVFDNTLKPVRDAQGRVALIIGEARNVTENRRVAEALRVSEEKYRTIFDNAQVALFRIQAGEGRMLEANPAMARIFGYDDRETFLREHRMQPNWAVAEDRERLYRQFREEGGMVNNFEAPMYRRDRSVAWVRFSARLFPEKGYMEGVGLDVTEEKRTLRALMESERRVLRADKMAALGTIVAGVAHEINNPNNFIVFNLPILSRYWQAVEPILRAHEAAHPDALILNLPVSDFIEDAYRLVENMRHGSERISGIVSHLKHYIRSHESERKQPEEVKGIVDRVMILIGKQVQKMVRRLDVEMEEDLPPVWAHAGRIEQVMINLILNAAQAADKPADSFVRVAARRSTRRPGFVELRVEDNGAGIDPALLDRIFDPFFTTKGRETGTGLGLSISQKIVEEHGGRLDVESTPGIGSVFSVELPEHRADPGAAGPTE